MKIVAKKLFDETYLSQSESLTKITTKIDTFYSKYEFVQIITFVFWFLMFCVGWIPFIVLLDGNAILQSISLFGTILSSMWMMSAMIRGADFDNYSSVLVKDMSKPFLFIKRRKAVKNIKEQVIIGAVTSKKELYSFKMNEPVISVSNDNYRVTLKADIFFHSKKGWKKDLSKGHNKTVIINTENNQWRDELAQTKEEFKEAMQELAEKLTFQHNQKFKKSIEKNCNNEQKEEQEMVKEEILYLAKS